MGLALDKLDESTRRNIAGSLFEVKKEYENKGEMTGLCPVHEEKNPSFSYNYRKDVYFCASCRATGDLIDLWRKVKGYDEETGFREFCREYGIDIQQSGQRQTDASAPPFPTDAQREKQRKERRKKDGPPPLDDVFSRMPPLPDSWIRRLEEERGWRRETIQRLDLRLQTIYQAKKTGEIKKIRKPERIAIPVRDSAGQVRNIRLYKPGGDPKIISWGEAYGAARLFPPAPSDESPVLLCEGEPDTICALSMGFNAITQTTKPRKWSREQVAVFKARDVIIAFDADQDGHKYAADFAAPNIGKVARSVKMLEWPDCMGREVDGTWPAHHGQDLTDFFVKHKKTVDDLWALIDDASPVDTLKQMSSQAMAFFEHGFNGRLSFKSRLLAEKVLEDMQMLYDPETGLMYSWNGRYWEKYHEDHVRAYAIRLLGDEAQKARAEDAAYQVKVLSALPHGREVNDRTEWVCLKNGMFNLSTGAMKPHDPDFYATYELNVSYDPQSPRICSRWLEYLNTNVVTPEVIMQLQEFAGYIMTRETRFEKALLLLGNGSDGKSLFMKIMRELVGHDNCSSVSFSGLEDQFQRSSLYQKTLNIHPEIGNNPIDSPYFKAITSGDPIDASYKHKNQFTFTPYCKLLFAGNRLPKVLDSSDGYYRRLLPIQYKRQYKPEDPDYDPYLFEKMKEEISEIFHWALVGLRRLWQQGHFTDCRETQAVLMSYKRENSPVICFVDDMIQIGDGLSENKKKIYESYRAYASESGHCSMAKEKFFRELYSAVNNVRISRPRQNGERVQILHGLQLKVESIG